MNNIIKTEIRYTDRAKPNRGYHDSEEIVTFAPELNEEEQLNIMEYRQKNHAANNMWSYAPKKIAPNTWSINFGYDSGD